MPELCPNNGQLGKIWLTNSRIDLPGFCAFLRRNDAIYVRVAGYGRGDIIVQNKPLPVISF
jgi:hypothetical protein